MTVKTGQAWAGLFVTLDATGALAAGTPSGVLYVDGVANGASVTITGSNPYKFAVTLPSLTAGQRVDMYITATISTIATASVVASEQADTALVSDVKTDTAAILADTGTDGVLLSSGTGAKQISLSSGAVLLQATQTGVTIPTVTNLTNLPSIPNNWLTAAGIAADAGAEIADAVWDEAISGHTTGGTFGAKNQKVVPSETIGDYKADVSSLATSAALTTVGSNVTSIKAKTDNLPSDPADDSDIDAQLAEIKGYVDDLESRLTATRAGYLDAAISTRLATSGYTSPPSVGDIATAVWGNATRTLSSFGTLIADIWGYATRTLSAFGFTVATNSDANVTAIKAKTDQLAFTVAGQVDSNALTGGGGASAEDVADAVWDEAIAGHVATGSFGAKNQKVVPSETINDYKADVSALALEATLTAIKGAGWADETLEKIVADIAAISAGSGASVADILNALLASYTVSGSVGESLGRLDNIQAKTDLITTGTSLSIASAVVGSTITAHRGDTLSAALENIGALTNNSKLWFTVKRDFDDADSAAVVQIEKTGGLLFINGAAGTTGNGSLTINDVASGDVTIVLNASETAKLSPGNYQYDIQILRSAGTPVSTLTYGEFVVAADVTKATA